MRKDNKKFIEEWLDEKKVIDFNIDDYIIVSEASISCKDVHYYLRREHGFTVKSEYLMSKDEYKKYTKVDNENTYALAKHFGFASFRNTSTLFILAADLDKINSLKENQQAFVSKGTDWPYFFKINGGIIRSNTSNWYKLLSSEYNIILEESLEPYYGPDKYEEHCSH